jgi:hypothetical protein
MKLYLTHIGRMMLKKTPIFSLPRELGSHASIFVRLNTYVHVEVSHQGIIYVEHQLAGYYASHFTLEEAVRSANSLHLEIVGIVEYREL